MIKALLKCLVQIWLHVRVQGQPMRVLNNERTLIVANHASFLDGLLLALFLPVDATFVVHTSVLRNPFFRFALRFIPHLAVDVTSPMAMKKVIRLLETGTPVVLFPEGRLSLTGSLMKIYEGAAFVAAKAEATVVRVRIHGVLHSFFTRLKGLFPRRLAPRVTLTLMPKTTIAWPEEGSAKVKRQIAGEALRCSMVEMMAAPVQDQTLFEAFLNTMGNFGRGYKLIEDINQQEKSYGDLLKMSMGIRRLTERFTHLDERVGVLLPNAAVTVATVYGLSAGRRVPAMLNYTAGVAGMQSALDVANVHHVLTSRAFVEKAKLGDVISQLKNVTIHWMEDLRATITFADKLAILRMTLFPRACMATQHAGQGAVILFTSGSEGKPKAPVHSHASILANVAQVCAVADFMPSDKFMVALPMFHSFGFTAGMVLPLVAGCKAFLYPSPLHYRVIPEVVYDRGCTVLFGTNTFLGHYARFANPCDFARMRYVVAGAEKLTASVRQAWVDKFGIRVLEGYGVTECAPVLAVNTPTAYRAGTVGQLLPGIEFQLEAIPGIDVGGVLHVKGPNIMMGYLNMDNSGALIPTSSSLGEGWYSTGDIVTVDAERYVTILGRVKRFAKIAGEMVSLEVVESMVSAVSPSAQHGMSTRPDASKGEALVLFTTDENLTRESLAAQARQQGLTELMVPRDIRRVAAIPVLGTGKTDYVTLKKMAENV